MKETGGRVQAAGSRFGLLSSEFEPPVSIAERQRWLRKMQRPFIVRECLWRRRSPEADADRGLPLPQAQLRGALLILLPPMILLAAWLFSLLGWIP